MQLGHASLRHASLRITIYKRIAQQKITAFTSLSTEASTEITDIVLMMMMPMDGDGVRTIVTNIYKK